MEANNCNKDGKNIKNLKSKKTNSDKSEIRIKKTADTKSKPEKPSKERLFDPISKKYIKPKNKDIHHSNKSEGGETKNMSNPSAQNNSNQKSSKKKNQKNNDKNSFPPYYIREMVEKGLKDGLLIEGTLRINPKNYEDAFVTNDMKNEPDIYIGGMVNRNRALNGDDVIVDVLPESEWKVNNELIEEYLLENDLKELPIGSIAAINENTSDMIIKFKRLGVRFDLNKDIQTLDESESCDDTESASNTTDVNSLKNKRNDSKNLEINAKSNSFSNGICVPLEELEEADFVLENSTITSNAIPSECESIASSDGVDIVIDDIIEVKDESNEDTLLNDSVQPPDEVSENISNEASNQEKKHRTRRKRGSKKKKERGKFSAISRYHII